MPSAGQDSQIVQRSLFHTPNMLYYFANLFLCNSFCVWRSFAACILSHHSILSSGKVWRYDSILPAETGHLSLYLSLYRSICSSATPAFGNTIRRHMQRFLRSIMFSGLYPACSRCSAILSNQLLSNTWSSLLSHSLQSNVAPFNVIFIILSSPSSLSL